MYIFHSPPGSAFFSTRVDKVCFLLFDMLRGYLIITAVCGGGQGKGGVAIGERILLNSCPIISIGVLRLLMRHSIVCQLIVRLTLSAEIPRENGNGMNGESCLDETAGKCNSLLSLLEKGKGICVKFTFYYAPLGFLKKF